MAIAAVLAALAMAGCGGSSDSSSSAGSASQALSQYTGPPVTATGTNTATSPATTSTVEPQHPAGGPKSANLPSNGAPDNAITDKTAPGG